jgi:ribonuclease J
VSFSAPSSIRLVPLGGLGEIGMNCLAVECGESIVVIDCGVTFPQSDLGVDVYHPDFSYLEERRDRIAGVVITHGHEDHIGALPYLLRRLNVPVWAPAHAMALARERLAEREFDLRQLRLRTLVPRETYTVGPLTIEPIRVTHSIADACALILHTPAGIVLHTGDFKFDPSPPDGELTDFERIEQVASQGVRLLLSDSTNIDAPGTSGTEKDAGAAVEHLVSGAPGRVVIGLFASNVQRLMMLGEIAQRHRRRICLLGRSANTQVRVATEIGKLKWPSDLLVPFESVQAVPRASLMVLAGGTQAEPVAALWRLATRTHQALSLDAGDRLILSSRIIPGNDPSVFRMMGHFLRQGVDVHSRITDPGVHVSGHAHRDEQRRMIELVRPASFIPVHGTLHHLHRHAELARSAGQHDVTVAENGDVLEVGQTSIRKIDVTPVGKIATYDGEDISDDVLQQREMLGRTGIAVVTLMVDARGQLLAPPSLSTRGILDEGEDMDLLRSAAIEIAQALSKRPFTSERPSDEQIVEVAQRAVRRHLDGVSGRRPVAVVHVVRP